MIVGSSFPLLVGFGAVSLVFGLVALAFIAYSLLQFRTAYVVRRNEPKQAYEARNGGLFEIEGTAQIHEETVRSPFTDSECLVCHWQVEEYRSSGKNSHWATIDEGTWRRPFRVGDDSGQVLVDPTGARFSLAESDRIRVDGGTAPTATIQEFIDVNEDVDDENRTLDLKLFELKSGNDRRYVEKRLDVGEQVHVYGYARPDPDREFGSRLYAIVGAPERQRTGPLGTLVGRLLDPPFLVSDTTEEGTVRRLMKRGLVPLLIGLGGLALGVFLL
ncbi:GIDE domain-containing protein [Haloarchaeobius sp. TZWWS8]|uniref:GIDE domain-containing protein n=1 Tax=Haloarchaeobius sp. TZWWS8 TaxID=3446121 RepID=UPI003EBA5374